MANAKKTAGKTAKTKKSANYQFASIFTGMDAKTAKTALAAVKAAYEHHIKTLKLRDKEVDRLQKRADKLEIKQVSLADKKTIKKMKFKL